MALWQILQIAETEHITVKKKLPKADKDTQETGMDLPMLPGTEQKRSLGEILNIAQKSAAKTEQSLAGQTAESRPSARTSRNRMKRNARERALQALYLWDVSGADSDQVQREIIESQDMSRVDLDYFKTLFSGIAERNQLLDSTLEPCLDRPLVDLDPIERAVLRIATFELMLQPEIPARVIINEGIEITKRFGADKGHRYINGVLDKLANRQRPAELGAGG